MQLQLSITAQEPLIEIAYFHIPVCMFFYHHYRTILGSINKNGWQIAIIITCHFVANHDGFLINEIS